MELLFYKSSSTVKPAELEKAKHTVFIRKNFVETENGWSYDEAKLSHDEFDNYCKLKSLLDSNNILSLIGGQVNGDNNQLVIMEAIADLYEMIINFMIGGTEE